MNTSQLSTSFIQKLQTVVGDRFVLDGFEERLVYECDACLLVKALPEVVALPKTTQEVADIVKLCQEENVPFTPRGAGTGLSGGALPIEGGVLISTNRMTEFIEIDTEHQTATVEVGVVNSWLNRELEGSGYFYAPDPSSQSACTIGGNVAFNAGGIHCIKYGVTTNHILGLEVVLPNGTITQLGGKSRRSHGLNFTGLMVGSEGTLGIVTKVTVKLTPRPEMVKVFLAAFDKTSNATNCVQEIIASTIQPAALEFMDNVTVKAVNEAFNVGFPETSEAVLLIELDGTEESINPREEALNALFKKFNATQVRGATEEEERLKLWTARKKAVAAYGRILPAFYLHDCVIPRSKLTHILNYIHQTAQKHDVIIGNVFHAGDGNLHPNILFDPDNAELMERVLSAGEDILNECLNIGGTLSGEHGIGLEKSEFMDRLFSPEDLQRMKSLKDIFDRNHLSNPGKVFPSGGGCGETKHAINHPLLATGGAWI